MLLDPGKILQLFNAVPPPFHMSGHLLGAEPRFAFSIRLLQPDHTVLQGGSNVQPVVSPHATLMRSTSLSSATSPSLLTEPSCLACPTINHVEFCSVTMEHHGVREASNLRVVVADVEVI